MPDSRPNILWISLEDTSPRFGCYGDPVARTPNIDRLAAGGRRYPNTFAVAGVCAPSRSSVITGMYPTFIGSHHMRTSTPGPHTPQLPTPYECVPPSYVKMVPEYLRAAGYFCTNRQKTDYQFNPPPSSWHQCDTDAHWRNRPAPDQPFFAVFNDIRTHESQMWDQNWDGEPTTDPQAVEVPAYLPDTPRVRLSIARQYDNLALVDERVGMYLDQLEADGLADNTIVFLWSDHGEGLPRAKRWPYDSGIREPMIVRMPGQVDQGDVSQQMVSLIDLGPTALSLAGVDVPNHMQGVAFVRAGREETQETQESQEKQETQETGGPEPRWARADVDEAGVRRTIFATRDRYDMAYDMIRAVRDSRYKYLRNVDPTLPAMIWVPYRHKHPAMQEILRLETEGKLEGPPRRFFEPRRAEELYDTHDDPHEIHNLVDDPAHQQTLERLREVCDWYCEHYDVYGDMDERSMVYQWWAGDQKPTTARVYFMAMNGQELGREPIHERRTVQTPAMVQLHCPTQGASIVWTTDPGESANWHLYTKPIRIERPGTTTIKAKAHRIGFEPGEQRELTLDFG